MATWLSEQQSSDVNGDGESLGNVVNIYVDAVTDADGMFVIDLTSFDYTIAEVIETKAVVLGQTLTAATDIVNVLSASVVEISTTSVKGVVKLGKSATFSLGQLFKSVKRAGSGINVKVKLKVITE